MLTHCTQNRRRGDMVDIEDLKGKYSLTSKFVELHTNIKQLVKENARKLNYETTIYHTARRGTACELTIYVDRVDGMLDRYDYLYELRMPMCHVFMYKIENVDTSSKKEYTNTEDFINDIRETIKLSADSA